MTGLFIGWRLIRDQSGGTKGMEMFGAQRRMADAHRTQPLNYTVKCKDEPEG